MGSLLNSYANIMIDQNPQDIHQTAVARVLQWAGGAARYSS
jgi:hypothetical protein